MEAGWYVIEVQECIPVEWSAWLAGLAVEPRPGGGSRLSGMVVDQAALYGVLARIRDLNLTLLAVSRAEAQAAEGETYGHTQAR